MCELTITAARPAMRTGGVEKIIAGFAVYVAEGGVG